MNQQRNVLALRCARSRRLADSTALAALMLVALTILAGRKFRVAAANA